MSKLGQLGRFGNQVFQYMFLKTYGRRHGLNVQVPQWIGNELFGTNDPVPCQQFPEFLESYDKYPERMVIPRLNAVLRDVDFNGFFQYPTAYYRPDRDYIHQLFMPVPEIKATLDRGWKRLSGTGRTVIAFHIRRGDYGYRYFYLTPDAWYLKWLQAHWSTFDDPVLYIATDDPDGVLPSFAAYDPVVASDVHETHEAAPFYPDFYSLSQADVVVMPNSSFSFAAAMLNRNLKVAYRSHLRSPLAEVPFVPIDPWDSVALDVEAEVDRFPEIEGIRTPEIDDDRNSLTGKRASIWSRVLGRRFGTGRRSA